MSDGAAGGPNAAQVEYWNATAGPRWVAARQALDAQIGPLGEAAMDAARVAPGERVLDVGCGCGATSLELARRVGPTGRVVGIDVSTPMLEVAGEAARRAGLDRLSFVNADAQVHPFAPGSFDLVFSRFGVMFFADPVAAFRNLAAALRPGGRLAFVCWQAALRNPWMTVPMAAALAHMPAPPAAAPDAPGPFAFADTGRVRDILAAAGFADIAIETAERELAVAAGADLDATVGFLMQLGPLGTALREADPALRDRVAAAVRAAVEPYAAPGGGVRLGAAYTIASATRP